MKRFWAGMLAALAVLLTACGGQTAQQTVSRGLEIDASGGEVVSGEDSHGGFHGDGTTCVILQFEDGVIEEVRPDRALCSVA